MTPNKPKLLDLFCCAGGAAKGYADAGFDVTGVDIAAQPRYPFRFVQSDALAYLAAHGHEFDAIHASPPCQAYTTLRHRTGKEYLDLVAPVRAALLHLGKPFVIENVEGAPLKQATTLCGTLFGLRFGGRWIKRHRLFETSFFMLIPPCACAGKSIGGVYGTGGGGQMTRGYKFTLREAREAMQMPWASRAEVSQAIPPAYTRFIGQHLLAAIEPQS